MKDPQMDSNDKFWLSLWTLAACTLFAILVVSLAYNASFDQKVVDMVLKGTDPIAARCAIAGGETLIKAPCASLPIK